MSMKFLKTVAGAAVSSLWEKVSGNVVLKDTDAAVGIGETSPNMELTVVNANDTENNPIAGFYTNNKSAGLIVDYKGIRAADVTADGSTALDANQDIRIDAKGTGIIRLGAYANSDVNIANGNLVIGTAGKGIDFSAQTATTTGTTTGELLDHYEEGTWTAAFTAASGSITILSSTVTGYYTRIGNLVTIKGRFEVDAVSSPSGDLGVTGLPFTSANPSGDAAATIGGAYFENASSAISADIIGVVPDGTTSFLIRYSGGTGAGNSLAANVDADTNILVSGHYYV